MYFQSHSFSGLFYRLDIYCLLMDTFVLDWGNSHKCAVRDCSSHYCKPYSDAHRKMLNMISIKAITFPLPLFNLYISIIFLKLHATLEQILHFTTMICTLSYIRCCAIPHWSPLDIAHCPTSDMIKVHNEAYCIWDIAHCITTNDTNLPKYCTFRGTVK